MEAGAWGGHFAHLVLIAHRTPTTTAQLFRAALAWPRERDALAGLAPVAVPVADMPAEKLDIAVDADAAFGAQRAKLAFDLAQALADAILANGRGGTALMRAGATMAQRLDGHALPAGSSVEVGAATAVGALFVKRARCTDRASPGVDDAFEWHVDPGRASGHDKNGREVQVRKHGESA